MRTLYKKSLKVRDLPAEWRAAGDLAPDDQVTVTITAAGKDSGGSPKRFIGAGKGLFASAREVDAYLRRSRNAWPFTRA